MPTTASLETRAASTGFAPKVLQAWRYVLMRRGNRSRMYWPRFRALLLRFPIVPARIVHVWRYP